jgi:hypothetical protein
MLFKNNKMSKNGKALQTKQSKTTMLVLIDTYISSSHLTRERFVMAVNERRHWNKVG